ncbi:related to WD-repeat protein CRB3 [Fusarium fujikuroi IMI 58289]|uniref:Pre-rRNA-processing protein IPI3 n=1 Tax=Gibberella fujikuroi (strain CBS 195.34 / IMI 58289 / NRRL A-6831) TaxID=1279085 RepID=S0DNS0_GIBF5|nr:related to WD-repeat protein CRB3 [Fusarium fujikuroi IMI 58289]CCT63027.1 related to WD-repeat protein CRB3 [Fusarium fujikuroi IMI 58289]SCN72349.1 related to WD-repeat protein CRB3 [Fusarium fujikuroi]SCO30463.1 related to WD-repeat protein CRB3 [Fusarium fujikuroi]SCV33194.1 related to WD-repeat protein CRB3 [Fusarium fujikuroi]
MLTQEFVSTICGPPLAANTAISKDVGIYSHSLTPSHTIKASFKKSSTPVNGLAVSESHIFAAQDQKAHVHVYSRIRGNQEALVPFPERIRSLALAGQVLVVGSTEGRLFLWETCTGRLVSTPPCHVQAVSCLAVTPYHILSGSDDSNINVWSISRLLELDAQSEQEPDLTLSNHRGAITSLTVGPGTNPETSICVSASKDKTCIIWNYQTGQLLRTLLFPSFPLCARLDPSARALFVSSEAGAVYLVELFGGDKPLLGSRSTELPSIVVQINTPLAVSDPEVGQPSCLALTYDGTSILSGHTKGKILRWSLAENGHSTDVANLNASVTNLCFIPPLSTEQPTKAISIVKPNQSLKRYNFTAQLTTDLGEHTKLNQLLETSGIPSETLEAAISSVTSPPDTQQDDELARQDAQFRAIINSCNLLQDPIS